jgi:hypothetical protein
VAGCCECGDEPSGSGATEVEGTSDYMKLSVKFYNEELQN